MNSATSKYKIFTDPVHGFISVPRDTILGLVHTPEVQRLRRIRQLGVGYLVFPGAEHTRFGHALGAMALMQDVVATLKEKGTTISPAESSAAQCAALLHDIGHGPFSHTLENSLLSGFRHELMSRALLQRLADRLGGESLQLALKIFDDTYERPFFHQLVSSQLDMDRLDYLRRDSFYTGVVEGAIGVQRIIRTMRIHPSEGLEDSQVVIEAKGVYAVESFLIARRLMYWQVYLHKTVIAGDEVLRSLIERSRDLIRRGNSDVRDLAAPAFLYFLEHDLSAADVERSEVVSAYTDLDDTDVLYTVKTWSRCSDRILADLCTRFINRNFFRVTFHQKEPAPNVVGRHREQVADWLVQQGLSSRQEAFDDAGYYFKSDVSRHSSYESVEDSIMVIEQSGNVHELSEAGDTATVGALREFEVKPYICYPKGALRE
ncbi:MAG: HD domain-containing protein [Rhodothermia bacterium]|nr:HD domain-containing protein [Rhodothermia bacterium]